MAVTAYVGTRHYRQELTVDSKSLGRTRRIVAAFMRYWGLGKLVDPAVVCVTELLANVSRHAGSTCVLVVRATDSGVRIVVSDGSTRHPVVREPDWSDESGRGMVLISTLASSWGVTPTDTGKDVWVELRTAASEEAA
ncbi:ATP-binding protein [Streptomyces acidiscabies]|uniref:ATP-binding protein n=1 Tax=Streptomyces acidiscabies TaxID=42234 RepID=A0AAP6ECU4_9ACTN|nr:ATP-binding protein [Streptomyces acidiscabies]MBP5941698.1 ATP-binding protein [Streptomyces sp. LBUM 1476]MBZ3913105.1 ATP-binding protein [Streptomyces acidiscabies]MDX2958592.1 ATP-binding protein [Streptomyces acidiscabies]MDX3020902.1 ATP-binding protein [Streptomyces acidiscabies]MDX3790069.1 ATP-binding protein [Streptomyces acidiscabies]